MFQNIVSSFSDIKLSEEHTVYYIWRMSHTINILIGKSLLGALFKKMKSL